MSSATRTTYQIDIMESAALLLWVMFFSHSSYFPFILSRLLPQINFTLPAHPEGRKQKQKNGQPGAGASFTVSQRIELNGNFTKSVGI